MRFLSCAVVSVVTVLWFASPALAGDWGENWGSMIWGAAAAVPSLPTVGLFVLALALLSTAAWRLRARKALHSALAILVVPMLAGVLSSPAHAEVTVPNTFTNGDVADADQINANFDALEAAFNGLNCATAADVVCNPASVSCPAAPACDTLGSFNQGAASVDITTDNETLCTNAGGTYNAGANSCSVDITTDNAAVAAAAGNTACTQAGGTWDAGTSICVGVNPFQTYNCFVGGFCAQAAIDYPPAFYGYTNVYDGHTQGADPALGAGCNTSPGAPLWDAGGLYSCGLFTSQEDCLTPSGVNFLPAMCQ